jgi:hypothetical protein
MTTFRIVPVNLDSDTGWVVKTKHDNGVTETSVVYPTRETAQAAADTWTNLDEDWAKV